MSANTRRPAHGGERFPHQSTLEALYDEDLSSVQVSTGDSSGLSAIGAGGLASGESIALPNATPTLDLMAHEVAHVVQNRKGAPPTQLASMPGDSAEREAKRAESQALAGQPISISSAPTGVLQGDWMTGAGIGALLGAPLGPLGAVAGGVVGGLIQDAMSEDEQTKTPGPQQTPEPVKADPKPAPLTGNIKDQWADDDDVYQGKHKVAGKDVKLGGLKTEEERLALLNTFSQNTSKDIDAGGTGINRCSATTLLGAAIAGGGNQGIKAVLEQVKGGLDESHPMYEQMKKRLEGVEKNMQGDGLSMDDLHNLNIALYDDLRRRQDKAFKDDPSIEVPARGVDPRFMKQFINDNDKLKGYFKKGNLSIDSVDSDGNGGGSPSESDADHFVLRINTSDGDAVFDTMAQKDGNQLRRDKPHLDLYDKHEYKPDQLDGADFGGTGYRG